MREAIKNQMILRRTHSDRERRHKQCETKSSVLRAHHPPQATPDTRDGGHPHRDRSHYRCKSTRRGHEDTGTRGYGDTRTRGHEDMRTGGHEDRRTRRHEVSTLAVPFSSTPGRCSPRRATSPPRRRVVLRRPGALWARSDLRVRGGRRLRRAGRRPGPAERPSPRGPRRRALRRLVRVGF